MSCSPRSMPSASRIPPSSTRRCSRSSRAARCAAQIAGGHTKNLFLRDKKNALYLVVALEDAEIDLKGLHRLLGATGRFSFGSADLLREVLGVEPGSVTPFGAINDTQGRVTVVLDADADGARDAQLPPAGQHHDHLDQARRSGQIPANPPATSRVSSGCPARPAERDLTAGCIRPPG